MKASLILRKFHRLIGLATISCVLASPTLADLIITVPSGPRVSTSPQAFNGRVQDAKSARTLVEKGAEFLRDQLVQRMIERNPRLQEARQKVQEAVASGRVHTGIVVIDLYDNRGVIGTRGVAIATGATLEEALENFVRQPSLEPLPQNATWTPAIEVVQAGPAPGSTTTITPFAGLERQLLLNVHAQLRSKILAAIEAQKMAAEEAKQKAEADANSKAKEKSKSNNNNRNSGEGGRRIDPQDRSAGPKESKTDGGNQGDRPNDKGNDRQKGGGGDRETGPDPGGPDIHLGFLGDPTPEPWTVSSALFAAPPIPEGSGPLNFSEIAISTNSAELVFENAEAALRGVRHSTNSATLWNLARILQKMDPWGDPETQVWLDINGDSQEDFCRSVFRGWFAAPDDNWNAWAWGPTHSSLIPAEKVGEKKAWIQAHICSLSAGLPSAVKSAYSGEVVLLTTADEVEISETFWVRTRGETLLCREFGKDQRKKVRCSAVVATSDRAFLGTTGEVELPAEAKDAKWVRKNADAWPDICWVVVDESGEVTFSASSSHFQNAALEKIAGHGLNKGRIECRVFKVGTDWEIQTSARTYLGSEVTRYWADFNNDGRDDFCRTIDDSNSILACTLSDEAGFGETQLDWLARP